MTGVQSALFAGFFDPPTLGHLDVIERACSLCERLYVAVAQDSLKKPLFSLEERMDLLKQITRGLPHVEVVSFSGLVVQLAHSLKVKFLIRGLRPFSNLEQEFRMALANRQLGEVETLFLVASPHLEHISSSLVKEVGMCGADLSLFLPSAIAKAAQARFKSC